MRMGTKSDRLASYQLLSDSEVQFRSVCRVQSGAKPNAQGEVLISTFRCPSLSIVSIWQQNCIGRRSLPQSWLCTLVKSQRKCSQELVNSPDTCPPTVTWPTSPLAGISRVSLVLRLLYPGCLRLSRRRYSKIQEHFGHGRGMWVLQRLPTLHKVLIEYSNILGNFSIFYATKGPT